MKTAKFVKKLDDWRGDAALYELSQPLAQHSYDDTEPVKYNHVIVSAANAMFSGPETYIFGADSDGKILDWGELEGSFRGSLDHARALENAGYEVI